MTDPQNTLETAYDVEDEYRPEPEPIPLPPAWLDGSLRIGIHTSIAGDIAESLNTARKLGCNALQIFSASPRTWGSGITTRIADVNWSRFRALRSQLGFGPVVIHDNYLINLASTNPVLKVRSIQTLHNELVRAIQLAADFLVVHPGSCGEMRAEQAIEIVAQSIRQAVRGLKLGNLRILIENTSGMGTAIGRNVEEIAALLDKLGNLPMGVCLDTAHLFHAGYDISTEHGLDHTLEHIERMIGLERIYVLHINDSKTPLGSRVDRHEHVGKGKIGLEAFRRILNHPLLSPSGPQGLPGRAFILETPIDAPGDDRRNIKLLWELAGVAVNQAPKAEDGFSMVRSARAIKADERQTRPRAKARTVKPRAKKVGRKATSRKAKNRGAKRRG
ncbi:MAG TPA: deoxyribonuclease IV [Candidatus Dormibacteraeota bacterium]|nr:deoxyribonuclease IV [Candidatus Dormibacteraeota bacterium]